MEMAVFFIGQTPYLRVKFVRLSVRCFVYPDSGGRVKKNELKRNFFIMVIF